MVVAALPSTLAAPLGVSDQTSKNFPVNKWGFFLVIFLLCGKLAALDVFPHVCGNQKVTFEFDLFLRAAF
jgi:hypothetical protein